MRLAIGTGVAWIIPRGEGIPVPPNTLVAGRGVFVLSGDSMVSDYSFPVSTGSFTLNGIDAAFAQGTIPILTAGTGVFTLTGVAAALTGAGTLSAQLGTFSESGIAAGLGLSMPAALGTFALTGVAATLTAPATFTGAGDVLASASWWVSPARAYNAAYAAGVTKPAMDIVDAAGANQTTINILSSGFVDLSAIAAWVVSFGSTIKVKQLYDQSGNARHVSQATVAHMPTLVLSSLGGLPALQFTSTADDFMKSASFTVTNPMTVYGVIQRTANFTTWQILLSDVAGDWFGGWAPGANEFRINSGSQIDTITPTVSDGAYHASGWVYGASSFLAVDGTTSANMGSSGTTALTVGVALGDYTGGGGFPSDALVCELGVWSISATTTNTTNMSTNQHSSANGYNF